MTVSSASEGKVVPDSSALDRLNNPVLHALLDIIDNSRELQVGEIVNPPQIIVVGDQSSGKSSVLEAISRVPFPVKSRLCTLFATELILRRGSEFKGDVRIQYGNTSSMFGRPERSIQPFRKTNFNINDLPDIVNEAKEHMGIGVGTSKVFSEDILVVEVTSPDIYPMTLVDLPGFFHSIEMSKQKVVEQLANKYMRQSNSIILAVVSANCCFKTQMVLHMSEKHDPRRERTLGIITKPDLLPKGSADEEETLQLAKNQETAIKLILGWHVLRNRDEGEQTTGADERDAQEERFFQSSPWSTIPPTDRGIKSLRKKLSKVLLEHIRKSLPGPVQEIEDALKPRSEELERLGKPRPSPNDIRSNRIDAAGSFQRLGVASEALDTTTDHICHYIPFPKNKRFVGRDSTLDALKQMLFTRKECRKVALVGLGGIGKTQVALQLAYWTKDHRPEYSIFWVPAMSAASFEQAYVEMARKLPIQKDSEDEDPKESVRRYLSSEAAGSWLLVVDNMEDMDLLAGSPEVPICISDCLPERDGGLTLFTTRSREVAVAVAGSDILELHEMDLQEAKTFLERSLIRKNLLSDNAAARELLDELTRLPLAISQAAAYLNRNQVSIVEYLGLLRGTEKDRVNLMSREFHDSTRYKGSQNAVATTWLVSFDRIRKSDNAAAILLSFMSCIDPKAIPRSILPDLESEEQMMHAIGTLCGYNFVVRREDDNMFDMHSLVYLATRIWVQREGLAVQTTRDVIRHLKNILPSDDYTNRNLWREYLPHAFRVLYENERVDTEERYELCFWVGQHLQANGRIKDAIRCLEDCYRWRESHFLEGHPDRLASQHALAKAYRADGQIKQAVKLLEYVVAVREGTLAENHPDRLASQLELAGAYQVDGQVKKADELFERITKFGYLDDEANSCDDTDLESLFSSRSSLTSQTHVSLNEQQLDGTILLTDFLFRNEDLNELYNLASTKVTASKLRIHLRGFFQRYGKDLEQEATNETEKLAAWFVRKYAGYVANEIKEALQKEKALKRPGITLPLEPTEINKQSVGRWLASTSEDERHQKLGTRETARPQFHPEVTEASRREDDEDSYGDSGGEEEEPRSGTDDLRTSYQVLGEVKQFLISAEAFQTLKNALRKWLKSSETNDAKATPENADENCQEPLAVKVDFTNATTGEFCLFFCVAGGSPRHAPYCLFLRSVEHIELLRPLRRLVGSTPNTLFSPSILHLRSNTSAVQILPHFDIILTFESEFPRTLPVLIDSILDILPFPISEPPIPPGQTRIRWKCVGNHSALNWS